MPPQVGQATTFSWYGCGGALELTAVLEGTGTAFPAAQDHMVVLADCLVFTAQAVRFHVPIETIQDCRRNSHSVPTDTGSGQGCQG